MIANQVEGAFETHFRQFVESVGGPEQGSLRCFADGTNQSLVIVCTQATPSLAWENSRYFPTPPLDFPTKWRLRNERRNSILMTYYYPDLGSASDWSYRVGNLLQPIRSSTWIWVVRRHQHGISMRISQMSFRWETSGGVAKCGLFSRATPSPIGRVSRREPSPTGHPEYEWTWNTAPHITNAVWYPQHMNLSFILISILHSKDKL